MASHRPFGSNVDDDRMKALYEDLDFRVLDDGKIDIHYYH